jgi:hypothetical protein
MKNLVVNILLYLKGAVSILREFIGSLDNCNLAWHEGKAFDHFQEVVSGILANEGITHALLCTEGIAVDYTVMKIIITTSTTPSLTAQYQIKRAIDNTNKRFGTRLAASIKFSGGNSVIELDTVKSNSQPLGVGLLRA